MTIWTPGAEQKLRELWFTHTSTEICTIMGMTRAKIIGKARRLGLRYEDRPRVQPHNLHWTPERKTELAELRATGKSWKELGKHYGLHWTTVANVARSMGLPAPERRTSKPPPAFRTMGAAQAIANIGGRPGRKKRGQEFNTVDPAVTRSICLAYAPGYDKEAMRDRRNAGKCLLCDEPRRHPYDFCAGASCAKLKQEQAARSTPNSAS